MEGGEREDISMVGLEDQVGEIGFLVAFLGHASREMVNSEFANPEPFKIGLQLCFENVSTRLKALSDDLYRIENAKEAGRDDYQEVV